MMRIKTWKVQQINHDMGKYGDIYTVEVKGQTWGTPIWACEDEDGFLTVTNVIETIKETEKAMMLNIGGFKCWVPKSAIAA